MMANTGVPDLPMSVRIYICVVKKVLSHSSVDRYMSKRGVDGT